MPSLNKCLLMGHLGKDPITNGVVTNFSIATSERWKDKTGQPQEKTEWHRIVVFGRQGEYCQKYLHKGSAVFVEGRIQTNEWTDKEGNKRFTTEIIASSVQGLSRNEEPKDSMVEMAKKTFNATVEDDINF